MVVKDIRFIVIVLSSVLLVPIVYGQCTDTEEGISPFVQGRLDIDGSRFGDYCNGLGSTGEGLTEASCGNNQNQIVNQTEFDCADFGMICLNSQPEGALCVPLCPFGQEHLSNGTCVQIECDVDEIYNQVSGQCDELEDVPEFGALASGIAAIGAGFTYLLFRRRN